MLRLIILCFYCFAFPLFAAGEPHLDSLLANITTLQADFKQVVKDGHGKIIQTSSGQMALRRPGKFRWDILKPIPQLIIAKDRRLWIYDPDLEQVTIRSLDKTIGGTPALLLSHDHQLLDRDFAVKYLPNRSRSNWVWFALIPKSADSLFESVEMGFFDQKIRQLKFKDHLGHETMIQFNQPKINQPLSDASFIFKNPPNVDVIDDSDAQQ